MRAEHLIGRVYDAAVDPKGWVAFVEDLEAALGGSAVALSFPHPKAGDPGEIVAPSLASDFVRAYQERYFALDPWTAELDRSPVGGLVLQREPSEREPARCDFCRDWLEPQGLLPTFFLGGVIDRDGELGTMRISVFRRRGAAGGRVKLHLAEFLMPHLRRAVQIQSRRAQLDAERKALGMAFDRIPLGLIVLDASGRVRAANRVGKRILAARDGISLERDGLYAALGEESKELRRLLEEATRDGAASEGNGDAGLLLQRPSGRRAFEALISPLRVADRAGGRERRLAALFLNDPEQEVEPYPVLLRRLYGLTPAEVALATSLASGHSLEEAAGRLGIAVGTARQRLQEIFAKTGTSRQAALVRLLLTGPAQLCQDS